MDVASQEGHEIIKRAPFVDLVFGPQTLHRLPELIEKRELTGRSQVDISFQKSKNLTTSLLRARKVPLLLFPSWKAVVNIAVFV